MESGPSPNATSVIAPARSSPSSSMLPPCGTLTAKMATSISIAMQIDQARVKIPSSTHTAPTVSTAIRITAQIDAKGNPIPCRNPATAGMPL